MKIRSGFVSNSSSSSYIVNKDSIDDWNCFIEELENLEKRLREEDKYSWGENGETFDVQNNFVSVETHYCREAYEILKKHVADLKNNSMLFES